MVKKAGAILLLAAILAVCISGCGWEDPSSGSLADVSQVSEGAESSLQEKSPESSDASGQEESPLQQAEPIVQLDCFDCAGVVIDLMDAGNGRVAVLFVKPEEFGKEGEDVATSFCLVNLAENRIEVMKEDVDVGDLLGVGLNGETAGLDYESGELRIYNSDFSLARAVKLEDVLTPLFDRKTQSVYCIDAEKLLRIGLDGEKEELASLPGATGLAAYDPENEIAFLIDGNVDEEMSGLGEITAYSVRDGRVLHTVDANGAAGLTASGAWLTASSVDEAKETVKSTVRLFDPETGWVGSRYVLPEDGYLSEAGEAGFGFWVGYGFDIDSKPVFRMIDLNTGRAGDWDVCGKDEYLTESLFVNGGRTAVCITSDIDWNLKLYLTAPEMLEYPEPLEEAEEEGGRVLPELPESLSELRELADRIEEEYAVRILVGEQCKISSSSFIYELVPTDGDRRSDRKALKSALRILEDALSLYPEDFFRTFRNYRNAGGIRFVMVDDLRNPAGNFDPAGVTNYTDGWYCIALDVNVISKRTVHHEIWHAVEDRISTVSRNAISEEEWSELNPPGFEYRGDYETYLDQKGVKKFILPAAGKDAYFVEIYSTVRPQEDRATLIEEILSDDFDPAFYKEPDPLTMIRNCPRLNEKLSLLEGPVRRVFGTAYWEDIVAKTFGGGA
ncbi:MAG: hypothetical protein ILO68_00800 [Clostridia bacterium]|nr:hypothetical protein [Clostridia bacterium]